MSLRRTLTALGLVSITLVPYRDSQALGRVEDDRAQSEESEPRIQVTFEGIVVDPNGSPAQGAVVVSSAGGRTLADRSGSYRLEVGVSADARSVQVTAISGTGVSLVASRSVDLTAGSALVRVASLELASGGICQPSWLPTFGGQPGVNDEVYALAVFDDGGGPALYVGGLFTTAGGVLARSVAKWDGSSWSALGSGMGGTPPVVHALTVFDDGSGPALYAAGFFGAAGGVPAKNIAKWDGSSWSALGSGVNNRIDALVGFDDGDGPAPTSQVTSRRLAA